MSNNREISIPLMEGMNNFYELIRVVSNERNKSENVLTEKQFFALTKMRKHDKIELKNLSKDLHVSNSSLCILLNKMVEHGYVYREEDSNDRRNTFYGITEEGRKTLDEEINKFLEIVQLKIEVLDEEKRVKFLEGLLEVNNIVKEII